MKKSTVKNGIIINDIVKMEWSASGYVETKKGSFTCASQEYNSSKFGTIAVFLLPIVLLYGLRTVALPLRTSGL